MTSTESDAVKGLEKKIEGDGGISFFHFGDSGLTTLKELGHCGLGEMSLFAFCEEFFAQESSIGRDK